MNIIDRIIAAQNSFIAANNANPTSLTLGLQAHFQLNRALADLVSIAEQNQYFNATTREFRGMLVTVSNYLPVDAVEVK